MMHGKAWRIWLIYLVLLIVAVPWYWNYAPELATRIVGGVPLWVVGVLLVSVVTSLFTAWNLRHPWSDEDEQAAHGQRS